MRWEESGEGGWRELGRGPVDIEMEWGERLITLVLYFFYKAIF